MTSRSDQFSKLLIFLALKKGGGKASYNLATVFQDKNAVMEI